jgi:hypothetical protein
MLALVITGLVIAGLVYMMGLVVGELILGKVFTPP